MNSHLGTFATPPRSGLSILRKSEEKTKNVVQICTVNEPLSSEINEKFIMLEVLWLNQQDVNLLNLTVVCFADFVGSVEERILSILPRGKLIFCRHSSHFVLPNRTDVHTVRSPSRSGEMDRTHKFKGG